MRVEPVVIASRFRGPPRSANGGYACGVIAAPLAGTATVRLTAPPPLDTALRLESTPDESRLYHGDTLLGAGRRSTLDLHPPAAPTVAQAEAAAERYVGHVEHSFPSCFVCGPQRPPGDGLRIFAGPVDARALVASPWIPDPALADETGTVAPIYLWSVLDCSGAFAVLPSERERAIVLGELTVRIDGAARAGRPHVVAGWKLGVESRKRYAGSAVYDEDGSPIAVARATWIEVPLAAFAG
jgi:hypothetical protein